MVFSCACLFSCAGLGVACPCCPLLVKGFAVWPVVCRRWLLGLLRETTSYVAAPRLTCLPSALLLCGARLLGRLCASRTLPCACLLWCFGQVDAVESLETGKGLTGHKLALWNSVKSSSWLTDETVGSFLGLPGREARRDLLHEASRLADGTYAVLPVGAQLLADALVTLLSPGVLSLWERGLGRVSSGSGS